MQCNDPRYIAAQEAAILWPGRPNLVVSVGCGKFRDSAPGSSCYSRLAGSVKKAMSTPPNIPLRLDPSFSLDEITIDAADRIQHLDSILPSALLEDYSFQDNLLSAAWAVIASQFYVEIMPELSYDPVRAKYRFVGIIRSRNPCLAFLQRHKIFCDVRFLINGSVEKNFRCPLRFTFEAGRLDECLNVELISKDPPFRASLSGVPNTISTLADLQYEFSYRLSAARGGKRKRQDDGAGAKRRRT